MDKLLPPVLQGSIPAFYKDQKKALIKIPFKMNRAVSWNEITGIKVKIKSIYHSEVLIAEMVETGNKESVKHSYIDQQNHAVYLVVTEKEKLELLKVGEFYKIQIAYCSDKQESFYSTTSVIKCTSKPSVKIEKMEAENFHIVNNSYTGVYSNKNDSSEKVYSYRFDIRNKKGKIVESSGELLHNHEKDESATETYDTYILKLALEENEPYTIQYSVTTVNGLEVTSSKYKIMQQTTVPAELDATLVAEVDNEEGYVKISLHSQEKILGTGCFLICRSSSEDNYATWSEMCRFTLCDDWVSGFFWKDFTISQGFKYIYSLQQYSEQTNIYSNRILSNSVEVNFEYIYLCDAKRQLKIKFNPKVASFKTTILEQKTNTLGGQFPFFFRNGNINYKEFSLSGLISYLSDEQELFMPEQDLFLENYNTLQRQGTLINKDLTLEEMEEMSQGDMLLFYQIQSAQAARQDKESPENLIANQRSKTTSLVDYNFTAERIFRDAVLGWLNNGEAKIYKSPSEGNFIVRINNVTLAPNEQLGRMIYSFSATATEIDTYNYEKLGEYGFLSIKNPEIHQLRWKTIMLNELQGKDWIPIALDSEIESLQCLDMVPGDKIKIVDYEEDEQIIQIGATGSYSINFDNNPRQVYIQSHLRQGQITYSFYSSYFNVFDTYADIKMADILSYQVIGKTENVKEEIEDLKYKITKYNLLHFIKRPIRQAFKEEDVNEELSIFYKNYIDNSSKFKYCQLVNGIIEDIEEEPDYKFYIDDKEFDIEKINNYYYKDLNTIPKVSLGSGVAIEISAQRREIVYTVEEQLTNEKNAYTKALTALQNYLTGEETYKYQETVKEHYRQVKVAYAAYLAAIEKALKEKEV